MINLNNNISSPEAEQALLGCIIVNNDTFFEITDIIEDEKFFVEQKNQIVYRSINSLIKDKQICDVITIANTISQNNWLDKNTARSYVSALTDHAPISANAPYYANIIKDKYVLRQLAQVSKSIYNNLESNISADKALADVESQIMNINNNVLDNNAAWLEDIASDYYDELQRRRDSGSNLAGLSTGFDELDKMVSGLRQKRLIVVAARPGMGKTSFLNSIALNVSRKKKNIFYFSLEMGKEEITERIVSMNTGIPNTMLTSGLLSPDEWISVAKSLTDFNSNHKILIDDTPSQDVYKLSNRIRKYAYQYSLPDLVIIDYLQLLSAKTKEGRVQEIGIISRELKKIAKEFNVPVLVASQLSRAVESRNDKRPLLSDLRESGAIEQEADVVIMLYRDEYYNPKTINKNVELIISKHRQGPTGNIELGFDAKLTKFKNLYLRSKSAYST